MTIYWLTFVSDVSRSIKRNEVWDISYIGQRWCLIHCPILSVKMINDVATSDVWTLTWYSRVLRTRRTTHDTNRKMILTTVRESSFRRIHIYPFTWLKTYENIENRIAELVSMSEYWILDDARVHRNKIRRYRKKFSSHHENSFVSISENESFFRELLINTVYFCVIDMKNTFRKKKITSKESNLLHPSLSFNIHFESDLCCHLLSADDFSRISIVEKYSSWILVNVEFQYLYFFDNVPHEFVVVKWNYEVLSIYLSLNNRYALRKSMSFLNTDHILLNSFFRVNVQCVSQPLTFSIALNPTRRVLISSVSQTSHK